MLATKENSTDDNSKTQDHPPTKTPSISWKGLVEIQRVKGLDAFLYLLDDLKGFDGFLKATNFLGKLDAEFKVAKTAIGG